MLDQVIELLNQHHITKWQLEEELVTGWEFYFIKHELDQHRLVDVNHTTLTVYRDLDDGRSLGSASAQIAPTLSKQEIETLICQLYEQTQYAKNEMYDLAPKAEYTALKDVDISKISQAYIETLKSIVEDDQKYINSYEIFVKEIRRTLRNSNGLHVCETYPVSMVEVVTNARKENHEIELYRMYDAGTCQKEQLQQEIQDTLQFGVDRLSAIPTPRLQDTALVLTTADAQQIYSYFVGRLNAQMLVMKASPYEIGQPIAQDILGDKITIHAKASLPNSSRNMKFDQEGSEITDTTLMENNVPKAFWGNRLFSKKLGLSSSFMVSNIVVDGGQKTVDQLRHGKYLEVVEFSDFQVDALSGNIFGEIRLGYLHDGDQVTPVYGGSVSGNMQTYLKNMFISKETKQYDHTVIPALTRLENVTFTPATNE